MSKIKKEKVLKDFAVKTFDGGAYFTFFTQAENHKKALRNLQVNSSDYKNIVKDFRDLEISIKELK